MTSTFTYYSSTAYLCNKMLDHVLRDTSYSAPSSVWLSLYSGIYSRSSYAEAVGIEISGSGYDRIQASSFSVSGSIAMLEELAMFPAATEDYGNTINSFGIEDASTSGNLLFSGVTVTRQPLENDIFTIIPYEGQVILAGGISSYLAEEWLDHVLNNNAYTSPGTDVYAALYSTIPDNDDSGGVEISGTGYSRIKISGSSWSSPYMASTNNLISLNYTSSAPDDWGTIKGVALRDASSGGNLLFKGSFNPYQIINSGDSFNIDAGNLTVSIQ